MITVPNRRNVLRGISAAGVSAVISTKASAAEFVYKLGSNVPGTHPLNVRAQEAANRIKEQTSGRVEIKIFPNNQLGGDTDMLSQVRSGGLELFTISGVILANLVQVASLYGIAFAMKDYSVAWGAMDGEMGNFLRAAVGKVGIYPMAKSWDNGYRQMLSGSKPITGPEDLAGFKIRVPISPLWTSTFKALGAAPVGLNWSETYTALQTKVVDGVENSLANIELAKIYEVQKYCAMTNYMWDSYFLVANKRAWENLPPNLREIVERNFNESALSQRDDVAKLNQSLRQQLVGHGMIFNDPDPEPFKQALTKAGYYKEWRERFGPEAWALLEKYSGKLA